MQYTTCMWIKNTSAVLPAAGSFYEEVVLAQKDGPNDAAGRVCLFYRLEGTNSMFNNFLSANANYSTPSSFKRNEWMHVAVVCDPITRGISYYINGERDTTCYAKGAFESCTGGFRIGAHKAYKNYWKGQIDELYFFQGLLSETDINKVMNNTYFQTNAARFVSDDQFRLYHNSSQKVLYVSYPDAIKKIVLYSVAGTEIKSSHHSNQLSTAGLIKGTYIARITDVNGASIAKNIIIE